MQVRHLVGLTILGLLSLGSYGCSGPSDPVAIQAAASNEAITVAPEATQGSEGAIKAQEEMMKKQQEADRAARRR